MSAALGGEFGKAGVDQPQDQGVGDGVRGGEPDRAGGGFEAGQIGGELGHDVAGMRELTDEIEVTRYVRR